MAAEGREAMGYDHGYDAEVFYLGLALDERYVEGFVEGCLERIGEDDPEDEDLLRGEWEEGDREMVLEILKAECEVRLGAGSRPSYRAREGCWECSWTFSSKSKVPGGR